MNSNMSMPRGPGGKGSNSPQAAMQLSYPMRPAGSAFLPQHAAFSDARPPSARGQKKGAGYPSYSKNP